MNNDISMIQKINAMVPDTKSDSFKASYYLCVPQIYEITADSLEAIYTQCKSQNYKVYYYMANNTHSAEWQNFLLNVIEKLLQPFFNNETFVFYNLKNKNELQNFDDQLSNIAHELAVQTSNTCECKYCSATRKYYQDFLKLPDSFTSKMAESFGSDLYKCVVYAKNSTHCEHKSVSDKS